MKRFHPTKAIIPNSFTALNLASGFLSIIFASQSQFQIAIYLIFVAALFDAIDGAVARLFKTSSKFGVELDSLADVVSFGAAPSALFYYSFSFQYGFWGTIFSTIFLLFGAFRLARFNTMLDNINSKPDFKGLPIPMAALTFSSFMLWVNPNPTISNPYNYFAVGLFLILSVLMVSEIKYFAMSKLLSMNQPTKIIFLVITAGFVISVFITKGRSIFFYFLILVLSGFVNSKIEKYIFTKKQNSTR